MTDTRPFATTAKNYKGPRYVVLEDGDVQVSSEDVAHARAFWNETIAALGRGRTADYVIDGWIKSGRPIVDPETDKQFRAWVRDSLEQDTRTASEDKLSEWREEWNIQGRPVPDAYLESGVVARFVDSSGVRFDVSQDDKAAYLDAQGIEPSSFRGPGATAHYVAIARELYGDDVDTFVTGYTSGSSFPMTGGEVVRTTRAGLRSVVDDQAAKLAAMRAVLQAQGMTDAEIDALI